MRTCCCARTRACCCARRARTCCCVHALLCVRAVCVRRAAMCMRMRCRALPCAPCVCVRCCALRARRARAAVRVMRCCCTSDGRAGTDTCRAMTTSELDAKSRKTNGKVVKLVLAVVYINYNVYSRLSQPRRSLGATPPSDWCQKPHVGPRSSRQQAQHDRHWGHPRCRKVVLFSCKCSPHIT